MSNVFLLAWDMMGIDTVVNMTRINGEETWAALKDEKAKGFPNLTAIYNMTLMRARFNIQRHYEVYTVGMPKDMDEDAVRKMFEDNPQGMADLIRERGECVYSARAGTGDIVIR